MSAYTKSSEWAMSLSSKLTGRTTVGWRPMFGAAIFLGLFSTSASAYFIDWSLSAPPMAQTGAVVPFTFDYTLDLVGPPAGVTSDTETIIGSIDFGNGTSGSLTLSLFAAAGTTTSASQVLPTRYPIPGTYSVGGGFNVSDFLCTSAQCLSTSRQFEISPATVVVTKSEAESRAHRQAAADARLSGLTLELFNALSGFSASVSEAVVNVIIQGIDSINTNWATIFGIAAGIIAAAYYGGAVGLAIATVMGFMGAYYAATDAIETRLANDPPDSNYQQVYQYGDYSINTDFGYGAEFNEYLWAGFSALAQLTDARQGQLTSLERGQAALLAGDLQAVARQAAGLDAFVADYARLAPIAGSWVGSIPSYVSSHGYDLGLSNTGLAYSTLNDTAGQLGAAQPSSLPEPGTLLLLGTGLIGLVALRRRSAR